MRFYLSYKLLFIALRQNRILKDNGLYFYMQGSPPSNYQLSFNATIALFWPFIWYCYETIRHNIHANYFAMISILSTEGILCTYDLFHYWIVFFMDQFNYEYILVQIMLQKQKQLILRLPWVLAFCAKIAPKPTIIPGPLKIQGRWVLEGFGGLQNSPEYPLNPLDTRRYLIA